MKFFCFIFLLLTAFTASSRNYYVSIKSGNSSYDGSSPVKPKKYIQEAADLTRPGDTVFVMEGTYTNTCADCTVLVVPKSGKKDKYIVYTNYPNQHPILYFNSWGGINISNGTSYIKINGFEVMGCNSKLTLAKALKQPQSCANRKGTIDPKYNGNAIVIDGTKKHCHHIVIANNTVHDCPGGGIGASQSDYITVEDNIVYNTSWYTIFGTSGISFYQFWNYDNAGGYHSVIRRNKCFNNRSMVPWMKLCAIYDGNGIIIDDFRNKQNGSKLGAYRSRTLIENNICWFNGGTGIHTFQSDHVDILNNTAYCNSRSKEFNPGQILSGIGNDNRILNNILVADSESVINSNYQNTNLTYENNLHYNITDPARAKVNVNSPTCINKENPDFIMPLNSLKANFRLQSKSPALHQANTTLYSNTDFDGKKRAEGHRADIGAYEF